MANPGSVSGLVWRLEAKDTAGLTAGDPVATATAVVGPNATQATSAQRPTWQPNVFGTQPGFRLDGADDNLRAALTLSGDDGTWFFVGVQRTVSGIDASARHFSAVNTGPNDYDSAQTFVTYRNSGTNFSVFRNGGARGGGAVTLGTPFVGCVTFDATDVKVYINGALISSQASTGTFSITEVWIAVAKVSGSPLVPNAIDWGASFVYDRALTSGEQATVHSYVQDTYAITVADYVAGGSTLALAGTGSGASTGTAGLALRTALAAAGTGTTTGTAGLAQIQAAAADGNGATTGAAALALRQSLAAAGTLTGTGSAGFGLVVPLAAAGTATTTGMADLSLAAGPATLALDGGGTGTTSGSAAIGLRLALAATSTATLSGTAALTARLTLTAAGIATTTGAAAVTVGATAEPRDLNITVGRVHTAWTAGPPTTPWSAGPATLRKPSAP